MYGQRISKKSSLHFDDSLTHLAHPRKSKPMFRVLLIALLCAFASSLQLGAPRTRRDVFSALAASPLVLGAVAANAAEAKAIWAIRPGIAGMTEKVPAVAKGCNVSSIFLEP